MANNTNWLNISQMTGGTGETALSLTALTNNTLSAKTATITAKNNTYNVSGTTTVTIQGFVPTLTLSQSTIRFLTSGGTATFTVYSNTAWTINFPSIVQSYSVSAGTGNTEVTIAVGSTTETDPIIQVGTVQDVFGVNQLFLTIIQDNFIPEITVIPDGQAVFPETGGSLTFTVISNCDWHYNQFGPEWSPECDWLHTDTISGTSGTTTVIVTADANGPRERLAYIGFYATDDIFVALDAIQLAYIPSYITVTPSSWEFPYTEAGKTFIVDSFPEWTGEIISTGETSWDSLVYLEATFEIPSAMTMPLYTELGSSTYAIYLGPMRLYGSSVTFQSAGTYKIRYELLTGSATTTPSFSGNTYLSEVYMTEGIKVLPFKVFNGCTNLSAITCDAVVPPTINASSTYYGSFYDVKFNGILNYPAGSDYSYWLRLDTGCLGYYNWNNVAISNALKIGRVTYNITETGATEIINDGYDILAVRNEKGEMTLKTSRQGFPTTYTFSSTGKQALEYFTYSTGTSAAIRIYGLTNVTDVVMYAGNILASGCTNLTGLTINGNLSTTNLERGVFTYVTHYTVGGNTTVFPAPSDKYNYSNAQNIREVAITSTGITELPGYSFRGANNLTNIVMPNTITSLGQYCFSGCSNLTNIVLPNSLITINNYCFLSCTSLSSVTLGSEISYIGIYVFYTTNLKKLTINKILAPGIDSRTFRGVPNNGSIYCPAGVESYNSYSQWLRTDSYYPGYYNWELHQIN